MDETEASGWDVHDFIVSPRGSVCFDTHRYAWLMTLALQHVVHDSREFYRAVVVIDDHIKLVVSKS